MPGSHIQPEYPASQYITRRLLNGTANPGDISKFSLRDGRSLKKITDFAYASNRFTRFYTFRVVQNQ